MSIYTDYVSISLVTKTAHIESRIPSNLLDNKWHTIEFIYQMGTLKVLIDRRETIIANSTYNTLLLTDAPSDDSAVLILGTTYSGCMLHGPGLNFNSSAQNLHTVSFGPCPLMHGTCTQNDVLIPIDYCSHEPCMQKGICISKSDTYECHCTSRYSGKNCEIDTGPPCRSDPCYNDGRCLEDNRGDYTCHCSPGFTGSHCETEISMHPLCENKPCLNNGTCKVAPGSLKIECECAKGYTGTRCEIDWDDCASQPCQNDGVCIDEIGGYRCNCNGTGYSGTLCQNDINECSNPNICLNGGICYDTYGSYICECPPNYNGYNCESPIDGCSTQPCSHGGTCISMKDGSFHCICSIGFSGDYCENGPTCDRECPPDTKCIAGQCCFPDATGNQCRINTSTHFHDCSCLNGGTCIANSTVCICPKGFEGPKCEADIDECLTPNICGKGICVNQDGGFKCYCVPGMLLISEKLFVLCSKYIRDLMHQNL